VFTLGKIIPVSPVLSMLLILRLVSPTSRQDDEFPLPVYGYEWDHLNLTLKQFLTFQPTNWAGEITFLCKAGPVVVKAGEAQPCYDSNNILYHADVHLQENWVWIGILKPVAMHETGHALGLAHSSNVSDLMYSQFLFQNPVASRDDMASVVALHSDLHERLQQIPERPSWAIPILR